MLFTEQMGVHILELSTFNQETDDTGRPEAFLIATEDMSAISINLEDEVASLLQATNLPVHQAAREFIILELYRRGTVSSGKAAELLAMSRLEFVRYASRLGISFFDMTEDEWRTERLQAQAL